MRTIDKSYVYSALTEIKKSNGIDVSRYIREVATSDTIPYNVLVFINRYKGLPQLETYNKIYERRRSNPLYKNLVNENLPIEDRAIALSSLMTQTLIHMKQLTKDGKLEDAHEYSEIMNLNKISDALNKYGVGDNDTLNSVFMEVRNTFKELF